MANDVQGKHLYVDRLIPQGAILMQYQPSSNSEKIDPWFRAMVHNDANLRNAVDLSPQALAAFQPGGIYCVGMLRKQNVSNYKEHQTQIENHCDLQHRLVRKYARQFITVTNAVQNVAQKRIRQSKPWLLSQKAVADPTGKKWTRIQKNNTVDILMETEAVWSTKPSDECGKWKDKEEFMDELAEGHCSLSLATCPQHLVPSSLSPLVVTFISFQMSPPKCTLYYFTTFGHSILLIHPILSTTTTLRQMFIKWPLNILLNFSWTPIMICKPLGMFESYG